MIEENCGVITAVEKRDRLGSECGSSPSQNLCRSQDRLPSLRRLGHLRLLRGAVSATHTEARKPELAPPEDTNEEFMPKRQYQEKRSYKEDDTKSGETTDPAASADIPSIKREFILTRAADETLYNAVRFVSRATGANLTNSHFLRVLLKNIAHAMPELEREIAKIGELKRPSNARGNEAQREEYEQTLAEVVHVALRSCPPIEWSGKPRKTKGPAK
jgi:hypothetical protein